MGITIHFKGQITNLNLIPRLQEEMVDICQAMNWKYHLWNKDLNRPCDARLVHHENRAEIIGHLPLQGISINIDEKNESLDILFNPARKLSNFMREIMVLEGSLEKDFAWNFTKTQFGKADSHIATVNLLKYLREKYVPDLEVIDEGGYWETGDKNILLERRGFLFDKIHQLENALSSIEMPPDSSLDEVIKKLEEVLIKLQQSPPNQNR
ncbi:hypothetical protein JW964_16160 [candidate division KSB1 bacterium]|nr:hypothetical protein [candidate division KSB1 bacterium]